MGETSLPKQRWKEIEKDEAFLSQQMEHWQKIEGLTLESLSLRGLGPKRLTALKSAGIETVLDLLAHLPKECRDYSQLTAISRLQSGCFARVEGRLLSVHAGKTARQKIPIVECLLDDGTGTLRLTWYRQSYLKNKLEKGEHYTAWGQVKREKTGHTMIQANIERLEDGKGAPEKEVVYGVLAGMSSQLLATWIQQIFSFDLPEPWLPPQLIEQYKLKPFWESLQLLHLATTSDVDDLDGFTTAAKRCKLQEFFAFQNRLQHLSKASQDRCHAKVTTHPEDLKRFNRSLPFEPTSDQLVVMHQACHTLNQGKRLMGLVQGDVGAGKTLVAFAMSYVFSQQGFQSALMAPTTLLARQHFHNAQSFLAPLGLRIGLLCGDQPTEEINQTLADLEEGLLDVVVGTHMLFQRSVHPKNLGLVMIDEQHRFGVDQRSALLKKGETPHYLAFSATPIPRSLALTLYGGFEIFQLKQKPAMRIPVKTVLKKDLNRHQVADFAKKRSDLGEAVFWLVPVIDNQETDEKLDVPKAARYLKEKGFSAKRIGMVHGQMDKDQALLTMQAFRNGDLDVLVATTVIEVGVDIPHATVMVIDGAHYFGLSQLHQLRGRVGRSDKPSFCFLLVPEDSGVESLKRMRLLERTDDGFAIADADLEFRGSGQLLGKEQSGKGLFRFGDPFTDRHLMAAVCEVFKGDEEEVQ